MTHNLLTTALLFLVIAASAVMTLAQVNTGDASSGAAAQQASAPDSEARTSADETFELNITERRITRRDFEASTSVEAGEESAHGLDLKIGVAVGADSIDVLLRNVRGQVRFRATLERVLERINSRRTANPSP